MIHLKLKLNHLTHTVINHPYWCITYKCVALVRFNIRNPDKISQFLFTRLILVYLIILIDGSMDCHLFSKLCWCRNLFLYIFRENHIIRFGLPIKLVMYFGTRDYICAGILWKKNYSFEYELEDHAYSKKCTRINVRTVWSYFESRKKVL